MGQTGSEIKLIEQQLSSFFQSEKQLNTRIHPVILMISGRADLLLPLRGLFLWLLQFIWRHNSLCSVSVNKLLKSIAQIGERVLESPLAFFCEWRPFSHSPPLPLFKPLVLDFVWHPCGETLCPQSVRAEQPVWGGAHFSLQRREWSRGRISVQCPDYSEHFSFYAIGWQHRSRSSHFISALNCSNPLKFQQLLHSTFL